MAPPCTPTTTNANDLFEYTTGRWIVNDKPRRTDRRREFNVDGLRRLAAESVKRAPEDIMSLRKIGEGGFNRVFLITMRDGFRMVARIPYLTTAPKYFAVASEAATMVFLRDSGLPVPEVYGYSPTPDNAAETEYIFMQFIEGVSLADVFSDLGEENITSILRQLVELESTVWSTSFPAGGSLYFAEDLANVAGRSTTTKPGVPLREDKRFCIGPETDLALWFGRRSQLDVDRGPYANAEESLVGGAEKEQAYLRQFGRPLLPLQRVRRSAYQYQEQLPSDHIENLDRYLRIVPSLIYRGPYPDYFCMRHPDLNPNNIMVAWSPDSNSYAIVSLIDWQHTSILPISLHAHVPHWLQDGMRPTMVQPSLPEGFDDMDEAQQESELELYRSLLISYEYLKNTWKRNIIYHDALTDPMGILRRRIFIHARALWEGETFELKVPLIHATERWEALAGEGVPCPIVFDPNDVRETKKLHAVRREMDGYMEVARDKLGVGADDWVPAEHYEETKARSKQWKERGLAAEDDVEERARAAAHWPFDDMDETDYL
ncbi:protein kinase subdomain-containing protein PKL/CAK/Fmp29 [Lenzites betulinus]|nr:protein kinase subdomain-containing protein PKL/CAK/Fmp29 [Lenzites betulinus]